tara:strand:+ start:284 stop:466 length:183 start_codon:yes stop_codon:yes gene_type:complete
MRKMMIVLIASTILITSCGSTKNIDKVEPKKEVVSGEHDPLMKLLLSGLIILSINFLVTK